MRVRANVFLAIELQTGGPEAWLRRKLDVNLMLNYHSLMHFGGTWDQTIHNYYFYNREQDDKWFFMVWDADGLFEFSATSAYFFCFFFGQPGPQTFFFFILTVVCTDLDPLDTDIYTASGSQKHYLRSNINKYMRDDYNSRMVGNPKKERMSW